MTYKDCMIDFETLATVPHAVTTSLGWSFFNAEKGDGVMQSGKLFFSIPLQTAARRVIDPETWAWWLTQDHQLFREQLEGTLSVADGLLEFNRAWKNNAERGCKLWGNGANFDEPILDNLYRTNRMEGNRPWKFYNSRCVRTIKALNPSVAKVEPSRPHDPEADAVAQAIFVQNCYRKGGTQPYQTSNGQPGETAEDIIRREKAKENEE